MPTRRLLTHGCEHHEIVDGEGLVMMTAMNPSLRSPETDSRSGLPMKNRRWRRLRIVKRDKTFSLIFSREDGIYSVGIRSGGGSRGPTSLGGAPWGGGRAPWLVAPGGPLWYFFAPVFFIYSKIILRKVSSNSENFYFCTKTTPW